MRKRRLLAGCLLIMTIGLAGCGKDTEDKVTERAEETAAEVRETAKNRLEAVEELGYLTIGIAPDYAPFAFCEDAEEGQLPYAGSDVSLGLWIAEELGVEAEFRAMEFQECLDAAEAGEVDMVLLGMLPKTERKSQVDFTDVYYKPGRQVILVKKDKQNFFSGLEDFEGKTVAAQYGTLQAQLVTEQMPGSYMELSDSVSGAVLKVRMGTAAGAALDEHVAEGIVKEHPDLAVSKAELACTPQEIVGGVVKGEKELLEKINELLARAAEEKLYYEWLEEAHELAAFLPTPSGSPQGYDSASPAADNGQ